MRRAASEAEHMSAPDDAPHPERRFFLLPKGRPALLQSWGLAEKAPWQGPDQAAIPNRLATAPSTWGGAWRGRSGRVGGRHDIRSQVPLRRLPLSGRGHQPRRVALLPLSAEPAHGGREAYASGESRLALKG